MAEGSGHGDPAAPVILALAIILVAAKLGGELASRIKQPAVLGELMMGVLWLSPRLFHLASLEDVHFKDFKEATCSLKPERSARVCPTTRLTVA